jgi:hypothetical protein
LKPYSVEAAKPALVIVGEAKYSGFSRSLAEKILQRLFAQLRMTFFSPLPPFDISAV